MTKTKVERLIEADKRASQEEDYEIFSKVLKKYKWTEDELRQFIFSTDKYNAVSLIFWDLLWEKQFTKDFLIEMFLNCEKKIKQEAERGISEHLGCIMQDLDPQGSDFKYAENIVDDQVALENIRKYLVYCEPLDKSLIDYYNFYPENLEIAMRYCYEQAATIQQI